MRTELPSGIQTSLLICSRSAYRIPPPTKKYYHLEDFVATVAPHFAYQLQLKSGDLEPVIRTEDDIKKFLSALYGGRTEKGEVAFDAGLGILLDKMFEVQPSKLLSEEVCFSSLL